MQAMLDRPVTHTAADAPTHRGLARSFDGRWLAVAAAGLVWIEDARTSRQTALPLCAGDALAVTRDRVYVARGTRVDSIGAGAAGSITTHALAIGRVTAITAAASSVAITGDRGAVVVRDSGEVVPLCERAASVRAIGEARYLVLGDEPLIVDVAAAPRATRLAVRGAIVDATWLLERSTAVLLLDRGGDQELAVIRATGHVLARVRVRGVHRIAGAAAAYVVALATGDGRVIVYDLRERRVISADRAGHAPCEIALAPDGSRLDGLGDGQLFVRAFEATA